MPALAATLTLALLLALCAAQEEELPAWVHNRIFWVSSASPMARMLSRSSTLVSTTRMLLSYIEHVERAVLTSMQRRTPAPPDDPLRPCNTAGTGWANSVAVHHLYRGWPSPATSCITELHGTRTSPSAPRFDSDAVYAAVDARAAALKAAASAVADEVLGNWTRADALHNAPYTRLKQRCVLDAVGAVRVGGEWALLTGVTNAPVDDQLPDFGRQTLAEYLRADEGGVLRARSMRLPVRPEGGGDVAYEQGATTALASWRGNANPSNFIKTLPAENAAMRAALDAGALDAQQSHDAMTTSGVALLALPALLNAVPVALVASVSARSMVLYAVLSDVVTVIPLAVKGGELVGIARRRRRAVALRLSGAVGGAAADSAVAELWAAECRAGEDVGRAGWAFLGAAGALLTLGVCGEVLAAAWVRSRRRRVLAASRACGV